ncbi:MAG TPA: O-antigen ligase family protein, partial [Phycisphaerae bacterium]|nr:O-antigen ligase family protein [Phycisphaerae bacterium]
IVGICNYMMVYQCNPNWWWWGKPLDALGIRYSMTAAVCLIVGMLVSPSRVPRARMILGDWLILLIVFTAIVCTSGTIGTGHSPYSLTLIDKSVKMAIFLYCFVRMGGSRRNFKTIMWVFVFGTLMLGNDAYHANADQFINGRLNSIGGVDFRDSSGLGAHMAAMLPLLGVTVLCTRRWKWKVIPLLAAILAVNTIVQCRTRSAFVGIAAGTIVALFTAPRGWRRSIYVAIILASVGAYRLTDTGFWERMKTVVMPSDYKEDGAIQARLELWSNAWLMFKDHPLGVGVGQFKFTIENYDTGQDPHAFDMPRRVTHNTYLLCASELGFHGFLVFAAILTLSLRKIHRCVKRARDSDDPREMKLLAYGCLLSLVMYMAASAFTDRLYTESFWWVIALPALLERALHAEVCARSAVVAEAEPAADRSLDPYLGDEDIPVGIYG